MRALVLHGPGQKFSLENVGDPTPGRNDVVVKTLTCGAGLTIQHVKAGRTKINYPRIIGHEITGEVVEVGSDVSSLNVGDPVTAYFYLTCGSCKWCRIDRETLCENFGGYVGRAVDGGYAELMKLPASSFIKIPQGLDYKKHPAEIGVICDAIATPIKVMRRINLQATDTVAIFGAGGGLGIHMVMVSKWVNAAVIGVENRPEKFEACKKAGADIVLNGDMDDLAGALIDASNGGVDVAIDFVSSKQTLEVAIGSLERGGRLATLGGSGQPFTADPRMMLEKELELFGSRYATKQEVVDSLELVARRDLWPLVTDVQPMENAEELHSKLENGNIIGRAAIKLTKSY